MGPSPFTITPLPQPASQCLSKERKTLSTGEKFRVGNWEKAESNCFPPHSPHTQQRFRWPNWPNTASCLHCLHTLHPPAHPPVTRRIWEGFLNWQHHHQMQINSLHWISSQVALQIWSLKHSENTQGHEMLLKTIPVEVISSVAKRWKGKYFWVLQVPYSTVITWASIAKKKKKKNSRSV